MVVVNEVLSVFFLRLIIVVKQGLFYFVFNYVIYNVIGGCLKFVNLIIFL